jgi:hypothetical protein
MIVTENEGRTKIVFASIRPLAAAGVVCELNFHATNDSYPTLVGAQLNEGRIPVKIVDAASPFFVVYDNFPNPFNSWTTIRYLLPYKSTLHIHIMIFNVLGQPVRTLVDEEQTWGQHQVRWDGTNDSHENVPSGIYFYRIQAEDVDVSGKVLLIR